jgi:hypothetical protein
MLLTLFFLSLLSPEPLFTSKDTAVMRTQMRTSSFEPHDGTILMQLLAWQVFGTQSDYYIVEAELQAYSTDPASITQKTKKEAAGSGANLYVYFAASSPEAAWTRLPDVLPEQIITARLMRRYLTGNLNAPVLGYPRFPWPEASFLRVQVGRIASATTVSPKGLFEMEDQEAEGDEELPQVQYLPLLFSSLILFSSLL